MSMNRRLFLQRLGITAGAAATATSAVAIEHALRPDENPALIDIGERLDELTGRYEETKQQRADAIAYFEAHKPEVPSELIVTYPDRFARDYSDWLLDVEGKKISTNDGVITTGTQVVVSYYLRRALETTDGRTREGRRVRKLLPIAQKFEEETENVRIASGYDRIDHTHRYVVYAMIALADEACEAEAWTIDGLRTKGRAVTAVVKTGHDASFHSTRWSLPLAEAMANFEARAA